MSEQYPGGYLTGSPVIPTASRAPGIWSLSQQASYQAAGTWPAIPDAQFNYVTMLLHGDGLNTAQNNTFSDSSSNNFTCTRNGNPTQGSFSPYGSNWSNWFQAGGVSYLTTPSATALQGLTNVDCTVEFWVNFNTALGSGLRTVVQKGRAGASNFEYAVYIQGSSGTTATIQWLTNTGSGSSIDYFNSSAVTISPNTWYHVAVSVSGTDAYFFLNGAAVGTASVVLRSYTATGALSVANNNNGSNTVFDGSLSNLRLIKGTALYTSAFTPSTTALTAVSGTVFLTCQSNRFIDNSSNSFPITVTGTDSPSVQRFNPFGANTVYGASTTGGSGYFDGSSDYLSAISGGTALTFGTNDFTVEGWVYPTVSALNGMFQISTGTSGLQASPSNSVAVFQGTTDWQIYAANNTQVSSAYTINLNSWYHFAVVRSAKVTKLYINGVQVISVADTTNYTGSYMCIGASYQTAYLADGYLSDIRVVNGTALYTSAFTPPTAPLTAVPNTQLLYSMTNAGVVDNAMMNDLETSGTAQISTSVKKYGTGSVYFNGSGALVAANTPNLRFGTGDFTIEFWVNQVALTGYQTVYSLNYVSGGGITIQSGNGNGRWVVYIGSSSPVATETAATVSTGTWYHIAVVRSGSTVTIYRDGTSVATGTSSSDISNTTQPLYIGTGSSYPLNGYIDDLRITKGYARYTANFTPPTAAFPNYGPY